MKLKYEDFKDHELLTDSRQLGHPEESIFFAIKGAHHDGHDFIPSLYQKGVRKFVIEQNIDQTSFPDAEFYAVENSIEALQKVATQHRKQFHIPLIGITGSNGKTIIKEWLYQLLQNQFNVIKSPRSYNSQIGVPLSVWKIRKWHEIGIFEAGISQKKEMEKLENIILPDIGILTNLASAHDEGFNNRLEKLEEKIKLFHHCKILIFRKDAFDNLPGALELIQKGPYKTWSWAIGRKADLQILSKKIKNGSTHIHALIKQKKITFTLPFSDEASLENAIHCLGTMMYLKLPFSKIKKGLMELKPVSMRLEIKQGIHNSYVIDDSYNNDVEGLSTALDFLNQQQQKQKKILILSDILESGKREADLYQEIAEIISSKKIDHLIGIGKKMALYRNKFSSLSTDNFNHTQDFLAHFDLNRLNDAMILIKGARTFQFERIVEALRLKIHRTVLEINLDALVHNLNYFKRLSKNSRLMVMVKAFAYGSGSIEVAQLLQNQGVDFLAVAYTDEGVLLRKNGIHIPIMVMNPEAASFPHLIQYRLQAEIYSFPLLHELLSFLDKIPQTKRKISIHIKIDTGMHRLGFLPAECYQLMNLLQSKPYLKIESVFSHLAAADDPKHDDYTRHQIHTFLTTTELIKEKTAVSFLRHIANSSGIARFPEAHFDMVRLGIGLYGISDQDTVQKHLRPISTLKTVISQIKKIKKDSSIGYGRRGHAKKEMMIATLAIGYADGFLRAFGNGVGEVLINGKRAPIIGNICMDMCMVDVTGLNAKEGDEVIVFGQNIPLQELADKIHTIPYEILTNISERVSRVYFKE